MHINSIIKNYKNNSFINNNKNNNILYNKINFRIISLYTNKNNPINISEHRVCNKNEIKKEIRDS